MMRRRCATMCVLGMGLLAVGASAGCSADIPIMQYPVFWGDREIRSVAVVPFVVLAADDAQAGDVLADSLAAALTANGTYERVMGRYSLSEVLTSDEVHRLAEGDPAIARRLKELADVDAVITGTVLHFEAFSGRYYRHYYRPYRYYHRYGYYDYGGYYYGDDYSYEFEVNEGRVSTTARMLATDTGRLVHATPPLQQRVVSEGDPPVLSETESLAMAVARVTDELTEQFAIVPRILSVKRKEALRITTGEFHQDEWQEQDRFSVDDTQMAVVINLPPAAGRNTFRLTIRRKDGRDILAEHTFTWRRDATPEGVAFPFDPSQIAAAGGGKGKYVVTFHTTDGQEVLDRKFKLVEPE